MNNIWFFNRYGEAQIIFDKNGRFIDRHGRNLGYLKDNQYLYNYNGKQCGWMDGYVIRDLYGSTVGFCQYSNDSPSPIFPIPQIPPIPAIPQIPPIPAIPQIPYIRPIKTFNWSPLSLINLFN
ncbi:hypothetical protein GW758_03285 [Candidatus Falkowbacteria bacterium]|nr:hypothetical protein [Candidatus Falkowbacteria bacterium]